MKIDHQKGGKWFIHDTKYRNESSCKALKIPTDYP